MRLLRRRLAAVELDGLAEMVGEELGPDAPLLALLLGRKATEAALRVLARAALGTPGIGLVIGAALGVPHRHVPVLLEVADLGLRRVDRDMGEVRAAQPLQLRVQIGEVAPLQQRVVGEVDARHDVLRAEGHLLRLGEEVVHRAVQDHPADDADRHLLLGDDLGGVQDVELELLREVVVEELHAQLPFREVPGLDRAPQVAAMEVRIGAIDLQRLVPHHRLQAQLRLPVELHIGGLPFRVDEAEAVDAEALHEAEGAGDGPVGHDPHEHVGGFRAQRGEVPEIVMRRLRLGETTVGLLLRGMDQVGELDRVLDEEDGDVVADEIPVAFLGVELHREAAHVAGQVGGALVARHGGEAHEDRHLLARPLEQVRRGDVGQGFRRLEIAMDAEAACMHHPLRDALMVEVEDLLTEVEILQQRGSARPDLQRVLVVGNRNALLRRQGLDTIARDLMGLAPLPPQDLLVAQLHRLVLVPGIGSHDSTPHSTSDGVLPPAGAPFSPL